MKPLSYCFALDCREDNVVAVGYYDGAGASSAGYVNDAVRILAVLYNPFDWRAVRAYYRYNPV